MTNIFRGRTVDVAPEAMIIEMSGQESKIEAFIEMMRPLGIIEPRGPAESPWLRSRQEPAGRVESVVNRLLSVVVWQLTTDN